MKMFYKKKLAFFMIAVFLAPLLWNQHTATAAAAATPAFVNNKVDIAGVGETYQLVIKNKVKKSKYKWSTSDKAIATVTKDGLVTSAGSGTANIKCKITYPSKKSKTLSCKVTVTIPATQISITNATLNNGAYQLAIGASADLDTTLTPSNSTDKVYWMIDDEYSDTGCIRIDDAAAGKITALKAGKIALKAVACKSGTQADASQSIVDAGIIIEVAAPSFSVKSAEFTSANQITVVFDSPAQKNTIIGTDGKLTTNLDIKALPNVKNVLAKDPGTLTPSLSEDGKTLTITSANQMEGDYRISFTHSITSTSAIALEDYNTNISYVDNVAPYIVGTPSVDDTGMICTINFSEPIDIGYKVGNAQNANGYETMTDYTRNILNSTSNYVLSKDKKSLAVNLTNISPSDYNKHFNITISSIRDLAGNVPASAYLIAAVYTDKALKPQAQLINVVRTSYNTLTATFTRAIQNSSPGYLTIENGSTILGAVDSTDNKKVNYNLIDSEAARYTGNKTVTVSNWDSFNVISTDTTGKTPVSRMVNFDVDRNPPVLLENSYDSATGILKLTYSEKVSLAAAGSIVTARVVMQSQEVKDGINLSYSLVAHNDGDNIIKLKFINLPYSGNYSFNLNPGFVIDNFKNQSTMVGITLNNLNMGTELPGPYMVTQSKTNPSEITLLFEKKLDLATATNVNNYSITGVKIVSAVVQSNSDNGAAVILTVADGTIDVTVERQLKISGVMGYNGMYTAITDFKQMISLNDNKKPTFLNSTFDTASRNSVRLNFSEAIQGSLIVNAQIMYNGSTVWVPLSNTITINGNIAYVQLTGASIPSGSYIRIDIVSNNLADTSGNAVFFSTSTVGTPVPY